MLSSHTPSIPVRRCSSATRAPKARYAGDVLYHRGDLVGPDARPKHRAHHRRPFLRCLKGAGDRPRQPGGCGRAGRSHLWRRETSSVPTSAGAACPSSEQTAPRKRRNRWRRSSLHAVLRGVPVRPDIQKVCSGFIPGTPYRPCAAAIWNSTLPQYRAYLSVSYEGKRKL